MKNMINIVHIIAFTTLFITPIFAQNFKATATIGNIKTDGLHNVLLTPEVRAYSAKDWHDVRIFDVTNHEVPYFIWRASSSMATDFKALPIISKRSIPNVATQIIFENNTKHNIDEIVLKTANSSLVKAFNISGSNNQKQWFGVLDTTQLTDLQTYKDTVSFTTIALPLSAYRYFRLDINDKKSAPINILNIGYPKNTANHTKQLPIIPQKTTTTEDPSLKKTRIQVLFDRPNVIDNLVFDIQAPQFYKRNARILANRTIIDHKKPKTTLQPVHEFILNSGNKNVISLSDFSEKEFFIEIDNQDNPPLSLNSIKMNQSVAYFVADLKANSTYTLKIGNEISAPKYDLSYFQNSISKQLPEATLTNLTIYDAPKQVDSATNFWQQPWFLWVCIGIAAASIFYFSVGLLKEMK
jgi:hypothetical protein